MAGRPRTRPIDGHHFPLVIPKEDWKKFESRVKRGEFNVRIVKLIQDDNKSTE